MKAGEAAKQTAGRSRRDSKCSKGARPLGKQGRKNNQKESAFGGRQGKDRCGCKKTVGEGESERQEDRQLIPQSGPFFNTTEKGSSTNLSDTALTRLDPLQQKSSENTVHLEVMSP
jgi:hypothetical protein